MRIGKSRTRHVCATACGIITKFFRAGRWPFGNFMRFSRLSIFVTAILASVSAVGALASGLDDSVRGRILLDVENAGQAWYVAPQSLKRYDLGRPEQAFTVMRTLGLGISNANIAGIPVSNQPDNGGDRALREALAGRILLQVESHGEAWYVYPGDLRRYYLGRPEDAFNVMRDLGLGITSNDLSTIAIAQPLPSVSLSNVPFIAQAPLGEWNDERQQEGCEEASVLMAMGWVYNQGYAAKDARNEIIAMAAAQTKEYGTHQDTSAKDTVDRLIKGYFGYTKAEAKYDVTPEDIVGYLREGKLVIAAVNGQTLRNPYFSQPAPARHMIVVFGYDNATDEFITHEPGTRNGANYRYSSDIMRVSLRDYASGRYAPIPEPPRSAVIVVSR